MFSKHSSIPIVFNTKKDQLYVILIASNIAFIYYTTMFNFIYRQKYVHVKIHLYKIENVFLQKEMVERETNSEVQSYYLSFQ